MSKYIDADRLRAEIERRKEQHQQDYESGDTTEFHRIVEDDAIVGIIDSLQQEQPELPKIGTAEDYYHKGVCDGFSKGSADALKILDEFMKRKADPVIVIKRQEQPEVDLEKEIRSMWEKCNPTDEGMGLESANIVNEQFDYIARHFYELARLKYEK